MTNTTLESRFREIGEGSVRFIATREEVLTFIKAEIASAVGEIGLGDIKCNHTRKNCGCLYWNSAHSVIEMKKQVLLDNLK